MEYQPRLSLKRKIINRKTTRTEADPLVQNDQRFSYKRTVDLSKGNGSTKFSKCIFSDKTAIFQNSKSKQINNYITQELSQQKGKRSKQFERKMNRFELFASKFSDLKSTAASQKTVRFNSEKNAKKTIPYELYNQIKHVFKYLEVLKNYGFSQKKIVRWMNSFLSKRGQLICDIFMRSYTNKKSLSNSIVYQRLTCLNTIIQKMQQQVSKLSHTQILFLINEIKHFKSYIEQIVIKKTQSNLKQMFCEQIINPMYKLCEDIQQTSNIQTMHFMKDLKSVEDRYGEMETVSKFNRFMFKEILQTQQKMLQQFYNSKNQQ